jgi:hypothetical protein
VVRLLDGLLLLQMRWTRTLLRELWVEWSNERCAETPRACMLEGDRGNEDISNEYGIVNCRTRKDGLLYRLLRARRRATPGIQSVGLQLYHPLCLVFSSFAYTPQSLCRCAAYDTGMHIRYTIRPSQTRR